jgi:hypothetical protein
VHGAVTRVRVSGWDASGTKDLTHNIGRYDASRPDAAAEREAKTMSMAISPFIFRL